MSETILVAGPTDFCGFPFGGTVASIEEFLKGLPPERADEFVLVGVSRDAKPLGQARERKVGSHTFRYVPTVHLPSRGHIPFRAAFVGGLIRSARALSALRAKLVYAHSPEAALVLSFLLPTCPIVLHGHGTENPIRLSRFRYARSFPLPQLYDSLVMGPALRRATRVIVTADTARFAAYMGRWGGEDPEKFVRVPSMFATDMFSPGNSAHARSALGLGSADFVITCVSRLEPTKGVDVVVKALHVILSEDVRAQLLIVGDGSQRPELESLARRLGVENRVRFLGYLPRSQIASVLSASDAYATASWKEGFSVALLEALACGVPAVSTDVGGAAEVIRDGETGFIARDASATHFAELLRRIRLTGGSMRMNCVKTAREYSAARIVPRLLAILDRAAGSRVAAA